MARIKIKDLNVSLEELRKKDPQILKKIRGGMYTVQTCACGGGLGRPTFLCPTSVACIPGGIIGPYPN